MKLFILKFNHYLEIRNWDLEIKRPKGVFAGS